MQPLVAYVLLLSPSRRIYSVFTSLVAAEASLASLRQQWDFPATFGAAGTPRPESGERAVIEAFALDPSYLGGQPR